jgi:predicted SAM-dependent methyltransferase
MMQDTKFVVSGADFHSVWTDQTRPRKFVKRVLSSILPVYLLDQIKVELQLLPTRLRWRHIRKLYHGKRNLLVNIGAGEAGVEGWINVDGFAGKGVNCVIDVRKGLPFEDRSVRAIFSEHFLEHLDYTEETPSLLRECYRVLAPAGVMRIVVPDAERYLKEYVQGGWAGLADLRPLDSAARDTHYGWTYNTRMELINFVFRQGQQHKFAYDFETIEFLLKRAGFSEVNQRGYGISSLAILSIDSKRRESESLYVEAIKACETEQMN